MYQSHDEIYQNRNFVHRLAGILPHAYFGDHDHQSHQRNTGEASVCLRFPSGLLDCGLTYKNYENPNRIRARYIHSFCDLLLV